MKIDKKEKAEILYFGLTEKQFELSERLKALVFEYSPDDALKVFEALIAIIKARSGK